MNGNNFTLCTHSNNKNLKLREILLFFFQVKTFWLQQKYTIFNDQMNQAIKIMNGNNFALCTHSNTKNLKLREILHFFPWFILIFQFLFTFFLLTYNIVQATFLENQTSIYTRSERTKQMEEILDFQKPSEGLELHTQY